MQYILFEDYAHFALQPFTFLRPVYDLRLGIYTFKERWEHSTHVEFHTSTIDYLQSIHPLNIQQSESIWVNGAVFPSEELLKLIREIGPNTFVIDAHQKILLGRFSPDILPKNFNGIFHVDLLEEMGLKRMEIDINLTYPSSLSDLFKLNHFAINYDISIATSLGGTEKLTDKHSIIYGKDNLIIEKGVKVRAAIINAEDGPVYMGTSSEIQEGAVIKGTHAICHHSRINIGAKLRGDSTVGPYSKIGGEVTNSVIMGLSNKSHEGYLGNSVVGYWCNMGADTNTSNLKNNYAPIKQWSYAQEDFVQTGLQFCGLMLGDHSKCGINTMFNTATVVGICSNIFGGGFSPKFIPSFSWGGGNNWTTFKYAKAIEMIRRVMLRRNKELTKEEEFVLSTVAEHTAKYRYWESTKVNMF